MIDFNVDNIIYSNALAFMYINKFNPEIKKIEMKSDLVQQNLVKKEWFDKHGENGISIMDVINNPIGLRQHHTRMTNSIMSFPIIIWKERELVIDGNHRLGYALINNYKYIDAFIFDDNIMSRISLGTFSSYVEYDEVIKKYSIDNIDILFQEKFAH